MGDGRESAWDRLVPGVVGVYGDQVFAVPGVVGVYGDQFFAVLGVVIS